MSPGPTFDRVYRGLKEQLAQGRFAPGFQLEPGALGEELCSSITPVRDALHRLVGERLVEAPRNDGFRVPLITEFSLRNLYGWSRDLLRLALARGGAPASIDPLMAEPFACEALPALTAELFAAIVRACGSPEHLLAIANANDRLAPVRAAEPQVLEGLEPELRTLQELACAGEAAPLRHALSGYHRRRDRAVPALVEALQSRS